MVGKALFLGMSAAFFIAFSAIAAALNFSTESEITPPGVTALDEETGEEKCLGIFIQICGEDLSGIPLVGPTVDALASIQQFAYELFAPFFQLLTFQVPGLEAASFITLLIFGPLAFINAYIIFTAIRGS